MKTPDEIKKGLECCMSMAGCAEYPYMGEKCALMASVVSRDALAYIQQLEDEKWNVFDLLSSAWFGKQCYFKQDDGTVYSRASGEYLSFDQALDEFAGELTFDRECAPEPQVPKWISVEDALPDRRCEYLVRYGFGEPITQGYSGVMYFVLHDERPHFENDGLYGLKVTHWMPLPELPKEER